MQSRNRQDAYNIIAAELFKLNSNLLQRELKKRGSQSEWVASVKKLCCREIRANTIEHKGSLKGCVGFLWSWIREQNISTRGVYMLLVKWLNENQASVFTEDFDNLCLEFKEVMEEGYSGKADISQEEIQEEWQLIVDNYLPVFSEMVNELLQEEGLV